MSGVRRGGENGHWVLRWGGGGKEYLNFDKGEGSHGVWNGYYFSMGKKCGSWKLEVGSWRGRGGERDFTLGFSIKKHKSDPSAFSNNNKKGSS